MVQRKEKGSWYSAPERAAILKKLVHGDLFESELHRKYVGTKRFSLEGSETLIPVLSSLLQRCADTGVSEVVFGMAHRGRLNVLANVMRKPMPQIFKEFAGTHYDLDEYMKHDWSSAGLSRFIIIFALIVKNDLYLNS
jgi:2-oxoglutarate dehydrogenase E1 component